MKHKHKPIEQLLTWLVLLFAFACGFAGTAAAQGIPLTSGPIDGISHDATPIDLAQYGYVEEEYFIEGVATSYMPEIRRTIKRAFSSVAPSTPSVLTVR